MAEQNGLEVLDKLEQHQVSTKAPSSSEGVASLTSNEEDKLSAR